MLCVLLVVVCRLALICALHWFVLRLFALCVVRCGVSSRVAFGCLVCCLLWFFVLRWFVRCIDLCWVWSLCVLFVVVCRLALRLVALCVVFGFSSCVDLCCVVLLSWRVVIAYIDFCCVSLICATVSSNTTNGNSNSTCTSFFMSCIDSLICVCVCVARWFMTYIDLCCVSWICVLRCVAGVTGRERFVLPSWRVVDDVKDPWIQFVPTRMQDTTSTTTRACNFEILQNRTYWPM